jgi:transcriptional regulator with XRE-family HTH domain
LKKSGRKIPRPTNFGRNLKFLRKLRGISQQEMALEVGLNRNNIASYESGAVEPNANVFLKISGSLKVDPYVMLAVDMEREDFADIVGVKHSDEAQIEYLKSHLSSFIKTTDEAHKIVESQIEFYKLIQRQGGDSEWDHLRDQIIELTGELLKNNWEFIQSMNRTEEE